MTHDIEPLYYETHSHTPLCHHAEGEPVDYAAAAYEQGLKGLVVTCHNPMPDGFGAHVRMAADDFSEYVDLVQRAASEFAGRLDVLLGLECDYFPGYESWLAGQQEWADFQYILGSVHPQLPEFRARYSSGDPIEFQRIYFEQLAVAAETRLFDCLAHPDLVKNETADYWQPERIMDDILRSLDRIAATGVAMELNTSGLNKTIREMNPFPGMLSAMRERGIPVVIGADAHTPTRVADRFGIALRILEEQGYTQVSCFVGRERQDHSIADVRRSIFETVARRQLQPS